MVTDGIFEILFRGVTVLGTYSIDGFRVLGFDADRMGALSVGLFVSI
jgi:hypothetical protein